MNPKKELLWGLWVVSLSVADVLQSPGLRAAFRAVQRQSPVLRSRFARAVSTAK